MTGADDERLATTIGALVTMLGMIGEPDITDHDLARVFVANEEDIRDGLRQIERMRAELSRLRSPSSADMESKEAAHQRFYTAFHDWFMGSGCDFWSECDAPEALASIAVEISDAQRAAVAREAREAAIEEAAQLCEQEAASHGSLNDGNVRRDLANRIRALSGTAPQADKNAVMVAEAKAFDDNIDAQLDRFEESVTAAAPAVKIEEGVVKKTINPPPSGELRDDPEIGTNAHLSPLTEDTTR